MAQITAPAPAQPARIQRRSRGGARVSGALALWRLRNTWRLTLLIELGMLAAVALVCAVPLFARVAAVAGLEHALNRYPNARVFTATFSTNEPTTAHLHEAETRFRPVIDRYFSPFGIGAAQEFSMISPALAIQLPMTTNPSDGFSLWATTPSTQAAQLRVVSGRLPDLTATAPLEVAITRATLDALHLRIGSTLTLSSPGVSNTVVSLRVVGVVERATSAIYPDPSLDPQSSGGLNGQGKGYWAVAASDAIAASPIQWGTLVPTSQGAGAQGQPPAFWRLTWIYPASLSHLDEINTDDLGQYQRDRFLALSSFSDVPWMSGPMLWSDAPDVLYAYGQRVILAQIVSTLLLLAALGLVLLFLSQTTQMLVESQTQQIAMLRSRGASRNQVFWTFGLQGLLLGGVALVLGPLLAEALTRAVVVWLLPAESAHAVNALNGGPLALVGRIWAVALIAALVAVGALLLAARRISRLSMLDVRQEASRGGTKPLWQRLFLDVIAAVFALAGYGLFTLSSQLAGAESTQDALNLRLELAPLALVAPIFLMVAGTLLFLRLAPLGLRTAGRLAARGRGPTAMLALTQLARATRPALRITVLLALTTCFTIFTLMTQATAAQRAQDLAAFEAGADISGGMAVAPAPGLDGLANRTAAYNAVPGVLAASLGYRTAAPTVRYTQGKYVLGDGNNPVIQVAAIDSSSFAQAATWSDADSSRPLDALMASLRARRAQAIADDAVPVIADARAWQILGLRTGRVFTLPLTEYTSGGMRFVAVEQVERIPTVLSLGIAGPTIGSGGLLVDYATFAAVYAHDTGDASGQAITANFAWLRTSDDPATLARVRSALNTGPLQIAALQADSAPTIQPADRREMEADFASDPIYVSLVANLGIEAAVALALALLSALLGARLWTRDQLPALATLRALGMEPRRIRAVLRWQHGLIYTVALALGMALGVALALVAAPSLVDLTFASSASSYSGPSLDNSLPVRYAFAAPQVALALAIIAAICALALLFSARVSARVQLGEALRVNGG